MRALITGASSGIGREFARQLSQKGIETVLVARREEELCRLADELNTKAQIIVEDLSNPETAQRIFAQAGDIDILINNAGFGVFGEFCKTPLEREKELISVNVTALHELTKLYLPVMKSRNSGYILNVASIAAFLPGPMFSSYYASKAYVQKLSSAIYYELKREHSKVKISCLCPGPVSTEFNSVAGVSFGKMGMRAEKVARIGINGMFKGKRIVVPGVFFKLARIFAGFIPETPCARLMTKIQIAKNS